MAYYLAVGISLFTNVLNIHSTLAEAEGWSDRTIWSCQKEDHMHRIFVGFGLLTLTALACIGGGPQELIIMTPTPVPPTRTPQPPRPTPTQEYVDPTTTEFDCNRVHFTIRTVGPIDLQCGGPRIYLTPASWMLFRRRGYVTAFYYQNDPGAPPEWQVPVAEADWFWVTGDTPKYVCSSDWDVPRTVVCQAGETTITAYFPW